MLQSQIELPEWLRKAPRHSSDPRKAAHDLRSVIEQHADESERAGQVTEPSIRALAGSGLWGLMVPKRFGGNETDVNTLIDVVEELSYADGSTGWIYMATLFSTGHLTANLGPSATDAMFDKGMGFICAGQATKLGQAERVDSGWRIKGNFLFGSGSAYASWLIGSFLVEKDGKPEIGPDGKPMVIRAVGPRAKVHLRGNWDVMGLVATGSYDFEFEDQVVSDDFVVGLPNRPFDSAAIYNVNVAVGHAAWSLGVGRRVLDEIKSLATRKRRFGRKSLIDQSVFQSNYGIHVTEMEAARQVVHRTFGNWYQEAANGTVRQETKASARLAACWATNVAARAGEFAYRASGSDGLRNFGGTNRLQRCFRDLYASTQHRYVDDEVIVDASSALLGVAPPDVEL